MKSDKLLDEITHKLAELEVLKAVAKRIVKHGLECYTEKQVTLDSLRDDILTTGEARYALTPGFIKAWNDLNELFN